MGTPREPRDGTPQPFTLERKVVVQLAADVPEGVTIDAFTSPVTPQTLPYHLRLTGTANDTVNGIRSVQLRVNNGTFVDVDAEERFGIWFWAKELELPADQHHLTVRALDGAGGRHEATAVLSVRVPFEPGDVDQAFKPTRYLRDLIAFAKRYVTIGDATDVLTPAMLAGRLHQPFDRLTEASRFEQATRSVSQARIAIEVLRGRLGHPAPARLDRRFRGLAYRTFLRGIGTSYDELRLTRTADPAARESLARRLGIGPRPDRLDELAVSPETLTDAQLEELTGYASTAPGDVLRPLTTGAKVLLWRRDALAARWQRDDETERDSPAAPLPIIDPDLVDKRLLRDRRATDPAFALWTQRRDWLKDKQAEIEHAIGANSVAGFDHLIATYLAPLSGTDIPGLAGRDANGADVRPDLAPLNLDLDAFRFLARSRALLDKAVPLETEWQDITAILLQIQKHRRFPEWREEERRVGIVLSPAWFTLDGATAAPPPSIPRWRYRGSEHLGWRRTLIARTTASAAMETDYQRTVETVEDGTLPALRDALVAEVAGAENTQTAAERLTRELFIDLQADTGQRTTRVEQALLTLQGALFSARAGRLGPDGDHQDWTIAIEPGTSERDFDREWVWIGNYRTWYAATRVIAYPENQLLPALYVADAGLDPPTRQFRDLIETLRTESRLSPEDAGKCAADYLAALRKPDSGVPLEDELKESADPAKPSFVITEQRTDNDLKKLKETSAKIFGEHAQHQREIFWLVPMALAAKLQESAQFQAALDWYRTVYAYHLPPENRRIYRGLSVEDKPSDYSHVPDLSDELNPHLIAQVRRNCYTKATIMAIASCFHAFADAEFARSTADGNARARTLYETAADLLALPEAQPEVGANIPFPANPVWDSLRSYGRAGLAKIHHGLNIAGTTTAGAAETVLPSQYRYSVLVERTKNLVGMAQQIEAAYLSALEQRDAKTYDALRAGHDLEVAGASVTIGVTKLVEAVTGMRLAGLQRQRAQIQEDHFTELIDEGPIGYEIAGMAALFVAAGLHAAGGAASFPGPGGTGRLLSGLASAVSTLGELAQTKASYERRAQEWQLQRDLAATDGAIGDQQIQLATSQFTLAQQEHSLAVLQQDHAVAVANFLATRFTNAELFEWMSGVLGRVYAYFLQQATALARLAEAQLAFERQELPAGFVGADYWRDATGDASAPDRRGLTGSARLLQDVTRLDQYAFETDRRKLHLTQTFPLSQLAAFELQQFRETGVLTFATPQELFDREFPGHYLRLIRRVKVSLVALLPPVRGVRATLSASGVSRAVVARGPFETVTLRRQPESIAFTSPVNATGLFELEPETGMLLPFEGMGVDAVWRLELPKPANPFDFRMIADVLLTVEYTALDSTEYRDRVVHELDRRFSGDRSFSIRNQFPDAWFELNNPDTVEPDRRMRPVLPLRVEDFPPHVADLRVEHLSVFVVRRDELADELTFTSLRHTAGGRIVSTEEVTTVGGIASTRRPGGSAWVVLLGLDPAGDWELGIRDDPVIRSLFTDELIDDVVLILTLAGTTPDWP